MFVLKMQKKAEAVHQRLACPTAATDATTQSQGDALSPQHIADEDHLGFTGTLRREESPEIRKVSLEERDRIESKPEYHDFFQRSTLLVERMLGKQTWHIDEVWERDVAQSEEDRPPDCMKHVEDYSEDRLALGRTATDVHCSPHQKEIFLAAYGKRSDP